MTQSRNNQAKVIRIEIISNNSDQRLLDSEIETVFYLYQILFDAFNIFNVKLTQNVAVVILMTLIHEIFLSYGCLAELWVESEIDWFQFCESLSWIPGHFLIFTLIAHTGSSLTGSALEIKNILIKILNQNSSNLKIERQLQNFLVRTNSMDFTVQNCFFNINWKLLVSVRTTNKFQKLLSIFLLLSLFIIKLDEFRNF